MVSNRENLKWAFMFSSRASAGTSRRVGIMSISSVDNDSMDMLVEEILLLLPETERRIIELYDFDSLPLEEVAQRVGLSHSYTERLLGKAHSFIKNTLSQHYGQ